MAILQLIRLPNLLMLAFCQLLIRYGFYIPMGADFGLSDLDYLILVLSTCLVAGGGYIINDINDLEIDRINKKNRPLVSGLIQEKTAFSLYVILTIVGVGGGFYLANLIGRPAFAGIFVAVAALLYLYASMLNSMLLVGNLLISVLVGVSLLIVVVFDLLPITDWSNQQNQQWFFSVILLYSAWSFVINLLREWVKDLQDVDGDRNGGRQTLPIVLGRSRTRSLVIAVTILFIISLLYQLYFHWYNRSWMVLYFLALVIGPLIFFCIKLQSSTTTDDYRKASTILKLIMFMAICSIPLLNLN
ncbi:geranylgeranylglycerol-phosphate geranylgeranyltransferase [Aureitalea marina]|uniref:Prenyltransferase n=1 Tax=Aureitalea marina TaxID=930804 RepID=A0A2S7KPH6_9FLAO|nr:geranylgeranylglycerol-phosphate geranylgeranyltransferase [Aureitalea marina]PQB04522.1 hypothetical protein BST85_06115 [Aureitalea marina]